MNKLWKILPSHLLVVIVDYSDGNGSVSGGGSEDEKEQTSTNEIPSETHREHHREIEKSTTEAATTTQSTLNLTLPCDSDRGGCEHECQMLKYYFDTEPTIQCSCYEGFLLDENDGRRCHGKSTGLPEAQRVIPWFLDRYRWVQLGPRLRTNLQQPARLVRVCLPSRSSNRLDKQQEMYRWVTTRFFAAQTTNNPEPKSLC